MICYDIRFCELSRIYALRGAELAHRHFEFSKSPRKSLEDAADCQGDRKPDVCCAPATVSGKSHGNLLRPFHHHRSMGNVIAEGNDEEGIITGSIELSEVKEIRDMIHMFRDRRPESYGELAAGKR